MIVLHLTLAVNAQFGINAGISALKFTGDVGKMNHSNYFGDAKKGYNIGAEYRYKNVLGVNLNGMYGQLAGTDNDATSHRNFLTNVYGGELNVVAFFDRLHDVQKEAAPFIGVGFGYLMFDPHGDQKYYDKDFGIHKTYNYWSDGSIRDLPESSTNDPLSKTLKRDYTYETKLTDSIVAYKRATMYIPINMGVTFSLGFRANMRLGLNYNLALTDWMDNYKKGGNDSWLGANASINIRIGKRPPTPYDDAVIEGLEKADDDKDGINDLLDHCEGTPAGVKVTPNGCPIDTDGDGIADYQDKEINSKPGAFTDVNGVTINEDLQAKHQLEWDSIANLRSTKTPINANMDYKQQVDAKSKDIKDNKGKTNGKKVEIPAELKAADLNKDGVISAEEHAKVIDAFFNGDSDFTAEQIRLLNEFFFKQ